MGHSKSTPLVKQHFLTKIESHKVAFPMSATLYLVLIRAELLATHEELLHR